MSVNRLSFRNIICRLFVIFFLISFFITACSPDGSTEGSVNWLPFVLAILFIAVLVGSITYLILAGKFQDWSSAGINAGKWKIQERKLKSQKESAEQEIEEMIAKLGQKAWEAKVDHPSYQQAYDSLKDLEAQIKPLVAETNSLEFKLNQVHESRGNLYDDYSKQLDDLASLKKDVEKQLDKSKSQQTKLAKEFEKLNKDQTKSRAENESQQQELSEVQASDSPDKDKQVEKLTKSISTLSGSVSKNSERISEIELEQSKLEIAEKPMQEKIARFDDQIAEVEQNQKEALAPLDQQITELEEKIQSRNEQVKALNEKMDAIMEDMGPKVESARPESEELTMAYYEVDKVKAQLADIKKEHHLVFARLEASDQSMVRNFYLMVAGILILVVLIVIFLVMAF